MIIGLDGKYYLWMICTRTFIENIDRQFLCIAAILLYCSFDYQKHSNARKMKIEFEKRTEVTQYCANANSEGNMIKKK